MKFMKREREDTREELRLDDLSTLFQQLDRRETKLLTTELVRFDLVNVRTLNKTSSNYFIGTSSNGKLEKWQD